MEEHDLRDEIAAAFDDSETEIETSTDDRPRDDAGRFVSKAEEQADDAPNVEVQDGVGIPADDAEGQDGEEAQDEQIEGDGPTSAIDPPISWSAEEKELFKALPPETQQIIARRESERDGAFTEKSKELAEQKERFQALEPVLAPIQAEAQRLGVSDGQAVQALFNGHMLLTHRGLEGLKQIARDYGIDLSPLSQTDPDLGDFTDPRVAELEARLARFENAEAQRQTTEQTQAMTAVNTEIAQFKGETNEDGSLKRPHFDALESVIVPLVQTIRAQNPTLTNAEVLGQAYDQAVWASPDHRTELVGAEIRASEDKRKAEMKQAAAKKKAAASGISGAPGGASQQGPADSLREEISRAFGG